MEKAKGNKASWAYVEAGYRSSSLAFAQAIPEEARHDAVGLCQGLKMLALCRVGGLRTAIQIANACQGKNGAAKYKEVCPCCGEKGEMERQLVTCCWSVDDGIILDGYT